MSYNERRGDLFAATDLDAIAHGVNCSGIMGAGVAKAVADRWPKVLDEYRTLCASRRLLPGDSQVVKATADPDDRFIVFNLATQDRPGPDARLRWVAASVIQMLMWAESTDTVRRIGMPRIGSGIGDLEWVEVRMILELLANESEVEVLAFAL